MDDQFTPIDQPPEELPPGMTPADFATEGSEFESGPPLEPGATPPEAPKPSAQDKLTNFVATPKGKAIAIGGVVGLLVVLGAVVFLVLSIVTKSPAPEVTGTTTAPGTATAPGGTAPSATTTGSAGSTMTAQGTSPSDGLPEAFEVFENKDPFKPLIVAPPEQSATSGTTSQADVSAQAPAASSTNSDATKTNGTSSAGGTTSGDSGSTSTNSLTLKSISVSNGEYTAVLVYGGKSYTVQEGDVVDSSPWKVKKITSSSVTMLYGDGDTITLTLGSSVTPSVH